MKQFPQKAATSIPQIRRDFTRTFLHGAEYLEVAGRKFDQPTHHARKILELLQLYDNQTLDKAIAVSIIENCMDIKNFRLMLKDYNAGIRTLDTTSLVNNSSEGNTDSLTRNCEYYENLAQEVQHGANDI